MDLISSEHCHSIGLNFIAAILGLLCAFFLCCLGDWLYVDRQRKILGIALFVIGGICAIGGALNWYYWWAL